MKKLIIFLAFLIYSFSAYSQKEFAPIGAEWYYTYSYDMKGPLSTYTKFTCTGETIIKGKSCKIIEGNSERYFLHEDKGKVYYYLRDTFNLIYDFTAQAGDTITFGFKSDTAYSSNIIIDKVYNVDCKVLSVDTVYAGNIPIKRFITSTKLYPREDLQYLMYSSQYTYYENIGNNERFLFFLSPYAIIPETEHMLRCYNDKDISFKEEWFGNYTIDCNYQGSTDIQKSNNSITVSPNPFDKNLQLQSLDIDSFSEYNFTIYNGLGKIVLQGDLENSKDIINTELLPKGVYFIEISNNEDILYNSKLIK